MDSQYSVHHGVVWLADELTTSLRVVRQPSLQVVSRMRRSQDCHFWRGFLGFMVDVLSCSYSSTELVEVSRTWFYRKGLSFLIPSEQ